MIQSRCEVESGTAMTHAHGPLQRMGSRQRGDGDGWRWLGRLPLLTG
jgi:hypothetical protein